MKASERTLVEEITKEAAKAKQIVRGLSPGALIRIIRKQIGMPQEVLARKAKVPQSTISRIEQERSDPNISTLRTILQALHCDLVVLPVLHESVDTIRKKQARKQAQAQLQYLMGTMHLEQQEPDAQFVETLLQQEDEKFLKGPDSALWTERGSNHV